jgi:Ca2+-binding RTX toxin-like protein
VVAQTTANGRRTAARRIVEGLVLPGPDNNLGTGCGGLTPPGACADNIAPPADSGDFMFGSGAWAGKNTGLEDVDLWVGGLAENTNLFGGLLGSTFNYVFENQLTNLQNGDRFYYLARTPGMNLRASLEGNSFAELVMRNSEAHTLKADPFATADCKFETGLITGPASSGSLTGPGTVNDVVTTDCDENALILQQPDGTVKYRAINSVDPSGINGQAVYNGTDAPDRVYGGNDNDTFWGGKGGDVIDGGGGDDVVLGGEGNDIITDAGGADVPKGGPGNDAIDGGIGDDIVMGGDGNDFTNGGANLNEHFLGEGNDFAIAGQGTDAVFGDGGDDWAEGGDQPDLLIGDSSTLFFDDHNKPGHDVLIGQGGDDDYDMEGGDDIGVGGPGVEKNAGASGWDWLIGQNDPQPQLADLSLPILNAPPANETRDRFNEVEALSGWKLDDKLLGDDIVPSQLGGGGFIGCDALDGAGLARVAGLADIVPPLTGAPAVPTAGVVDAATTNYCGLTGAFVWGEGNILLGGEGSDTLTGRGADDIIDGDRWVRVRIAHRPGGNETGWTDLMENKAVSGNFGPGTTGMTLQQAVFAGLVDPGNLVVVREVVRPEAPLLAAADCGAAAPLNCDTAVFLGPRSAYVLTTALDGTVTVNQTGAVDRLVQKVSDGIDTVRNVEQLKFSDQTVSVGSAASVTPGTGLAFGNQRLNVTSSTLLATVTNTGTAPVTLMGASISGPEATLFSLPAPVGCTNVVLQVGLSCTVTVDFRPTSAGPKSATLSVTRTGGPAMTIPLTGNGVVVASAPTPPTMLSTLQTTGKLTARWSPNDDGGAAVSKFTVQVVGPNGAVVGAPRDVGPTVTASDFTGLTVGTAYRFQVAATNINGTSAFSALSAPMVFATTPNAPRNVSAARGGGGAPLTADIKFRGPVNTGGIPLAGFRVWAVNAAGTTVSDVFTVAANARSLTFTFTSTASVRLRVEAFNTVGASSVVTTASVTPR